MRASTCGAEFVMCDAYVDQGRSIGNDPVGFKCGAQACYVVDGHDLCSRCADLLEREPDRVHFETHDDEQDESIFPADDVCEFYSDILDPIAEMDRECEGDYNPLCDRCSHFKGDPE